MNWSKEFFLHNSMRFSPDFFLKEKSISPVESQNSIIHLFMFESAMSADVIAQKRGVFYLEKNA